MKKFLLACAVYNMSVFAQTMDIECELQQIRSMLPQPGSALCDGAINLEFSGDFLYWISNQDAIWMGTIENPPAFLSGSNVFSNVQILNQKFKYGPGFRVAGSYYWTDKSWENKLSWTQYNTSSTSQDSAGPEDIIMSSWGFASRVNLFTILDIQQTWKLNYDVIDLTAVSCNFNYDKFSFNPTLGLRGAFIDQKIDQEIIIADIPGIFVGPSGTMTGKNKFSSIGVLASTTLNYNIYGGLSLFGNVLGSLNYGRNKHFQDYRFFINDGEPLTAYTPTDKVYRVRANAEIQAGLCWERTIVNDRAQISLMLAYEQIIWFNMNFFRRYFAEEGAAGTLQFSIVDLYGDLTLRGLTARAGLSF